MTAISAQPTLFGSESPPVDTYLVKPVTATGLEFIPEPSADQVLGMIRLAKPNPRGRSNCKVKYRIPKSWRNEHHQAAFHIACHWFRDIGGFQTLKHSQLSHIVQCLVDEVQPREIHEAIRTYADSGWHKNSKGWTTIERFFLGDHLAKWIDESPTLRNERNRQQSSLADKRLREHFDKQYAEEEKMRAAAKAASRTKAAPQSEPSKVELSLDTIVSKLPKQFRWVIPTLLKKNADSQAKKRAKEQALRIWPQIKALAPDAVKQRINVKVQLEAYRSGDEIDDVTDTSFAQLQLSALLKEMRRDYRQPHSVAQVAEGLL